MLGFILAAVVLAFAHRGKGGGWKTWGILKPDTSSTISHGLTALIAGVVGGAFCSSFYAIIPLALLFFLGTKPDIGTGFAVVHGNPVTLTADLTQKRDWYNPLVLADKVALKVLNKSGSAYLAGYVWMLFRGLFFAPYVGLVAILSHGSPLGLLALGMFPAAYAFGTLAWLAGEKLGRTWDPIEIAEFAVGPVIALALTLATTHVLLAERLGAGRYDSPSFSHSSFIHNRLALQDGRGLHAA